MIKYKHHIVVSGKCWGDEYDHAMTVFIAKKTGFGAEVGTLKFVRIWLPSSL